jgi:hypothetical protein
MFWLRVQLEGSIRIIPARACHHHCWGWGRCRGSEAGNSLRFSEDVEDGYVYPSTEIQPEEPQTAKENPIFILEGHDTVVQYLFELSGPPVPGVVSSTAEWENEL